MKKFLSVFLMCLMGTSCQMFSSVQPIAPSSEEASRQILGKSQAEVRRTFGDPIVCRTEDPYHLWTYRQNSCSTLIYFDAAKTARYVDKKGDCPSDASQSHATDFSTTAVKD